MNPLVEKNKIRIEEICENNNIKSLYFFGSIVDSNRFHVDSDIDVAVFLDYPDHRQRLELAAKLFHFAGNIDIDIEPKCFFWDEYNVCDQGSILSEILNTAIEMKN